MPHFYIDIYNGNGLAEDSIGYDLPDVDAARKEALDGIRSIIADEARRGVLDLRGRAVIRGRGDDLITVPFADAFEVHMGSGR